MAPPLGVTEICQALVKITPITLEDRSRSLLKYERSLKQDQSTSINLFLLLFMGSTVLFSIIYRFYCTISVNFYFHL